MLYEQQQISYNLMALSAFIHIGMRTRRWALELRMVASSLFAALNIGHLI